MTASTPADGWPTGPGPALAGVGSGTMERPDGERLAWLALASVDGIGPATFGGLVRRFGSARAALDAFEADPLGQLTLPPDPDPHGGGRADLDPAVRANLADAQARLAELLEDLAGSGLAILTLTDAGYPPALRAIELAPPVLFVRGRVDVLAHAPSVAVVGTRRPTAAGRWLAARIGGALARAGAGTVSGLAIGIDGAAHEGALVEGGPTVAVLGSGHRQLTPTAHRGLADRIVAAGGAVISEFPPRMGPARGSFPRRNRIISGLASATVVVEAAERSGALITAAWALEQGRECFIVPGRLDDPAARGCLRFLRDHTGLARVVAGIPELLEDLDLGGADPLAGGPDDATLGAVERQVAAAIGAGATIDGLAAATGLPAASLLGALTMLELRGLVVPILGSYRPAGRLLTRGLGPGPGPRATVPGAVPRRAPTRRPHAASPPSGPARPFAGSSRPVLP